MARAGWIVAGFAACLLAAATARGGDELTALLENLAKTEDAGARREMVAQLANDPALRAAERLRHLVRTDPDPTVRVAAASALGTSPVRECTDFLVELIVEGGPHDVRRTLAQSLVRRKGRDALLAHFEKSAEDPLARGLILEALAEDASLEAAGVLEHHARGADPFLRVEALRALARQKEGGDVVPALLKELLAKQHDIDTIMAGLDLAESMADADFRSLMDVLDTFLEPEVQGALEAAKRRLAYLDAVAASKKQQKDGYGSALSVPLPPEPRPRVDIVYLFDASGSVCGHLDAIKKRIRREFDTLARTGCDFRLGLVAYRDTCGKAGQWDTKTLPITYDVAKAEAFINSVGAAGCGTGGALPEAFDQGLSRMGWRWGARRQIALITDSKMGPPGRAAATARIHYLADHTRVDVWYLYRTRTQLPPDVEQIAKIGGGIVESLE
jgi:hypothetical protein